MTVCEQPHPVALGYPSARPARVWRRSVAPLVHTVAWMFFAPAPMLVLATPLLNVLELPWWIDQGFRECLWLLILCSGLGIPISFIALCLGRRAAGIALVLNCTVVLLAPGFMPGRMVPFGL